MFLVGFVMLQETMNSLAATPDSPPMIVYVQQSNGTLRQAVIDRLHALAAKQKGVFNEDVTALVAPFFPSGQSFEETNDTIKHENVGKLRRFKGQMEPGDGAMFITDFNLMTAAFSHVFVVIDLSFVEDANGKMVVRKSRAFLRSNNM